MKQMKVVASLAFFLNVALIASSYSVSKEALGRVDPIVFTFFQMMTLVIPGVFILAWNWRSITRDAIRGGFIMGSCLCLGLFTLSVALKHNTATGTAFFPALNGLLAALFTWIFLRQPISKVTWFAGIVSVSGAVLLMLNASMGGVRGTLIAFLGGLFCTSYIFVADHQQRNQKAQWALFGVELLTMALWANLIVLLFGDWQTVHLDMPKDLLIILYMGLGTIFLPTLITLLFQKYISPVTVAFIYILEPIVAALVAYFYLHERLPLDSYLGGALVVGGAIINTWSMLERPATRPQVRPLQYPQSGSINPNGSSGFTLGSLLYPVLCCGIGMFIVYRLSGFPPQAWYELVRLGPQFPQMVQEGQGLAVSLLVAQAASWLIAWGSILIMGYIALYRISERLFSRVPVQANLDLDMRTLRQMGYTPYASGTGREYGDKPLIQRRRQNRRERLRSERSFDGLPENVPMLPLEPEHYLHDHNTDTSGNYWAHWDTVERDSRTIEKVRER